MASERDHGAAHRPQPTRSELLKPAEVAKWLSVEEKTLAQWRSQGKGPDFTRIGRAIRYRPEEIENYIVANEAGGARREGAGTTKRSEEKSGIIAKKAGLHRSKKHKIVRSSTKKIKKSRRRIAP